MGMLNNLIQALWQSLFLVKADVLNHEAITLRWKDEEQVFERKNMLEWTHLYWFTPRKGLTLLIFQYKFQVLYPLVVEEELGELIFK